MLAMELHRELAAAKLEIEDASAQASSLDPCLLHSLILTRIEILKITVAIVEQKLLASETGTPSAAVVPITAENPELAASLAAELWVQERALSQAKQELAEFSGGLVYAIHQSTVATQQQTMALLRQRWLIARFGLAFPAISSNREESAVAPSSLPARPAQVNEQEAIIVVRLLKKQFTESDYQEYIFFDLEFVPVGLDRPTRAVKGLMHLRDLFGETKMVINWTLEDGLTPGKSLLQYGTGFQYNQFLADHVWANSTKLENMTAAFVVQSIIYADGSRRSFLLGRD